MNDPTTASPLTSSSGSSGTSATPVVTSVAPSSGPTSGGTTVTITGSGFTGATSVRFGGNQAASFTVTSATRITAVTPPGAGTVRVTVSTSAGSSRDNVTFTYVVTSTPAPVLTSLSPPSGPAAGGTTVTLTGTNLTGATAVSFGATPAVSFTVTSASSITAVAPPGSGTVLVTVVTAAGTSNGLPYSYTLLPALTGISPAQGPAAGGATVTLTGSGLTGATAVSFGATPAASFTVVSDTSLTAVTPPGAQGPVQVTVTTPSGTSNPVVYSYLAAPVLTSISPDQGPTSGGTVVTLSGSGLAYTGSVLFGTTPAAFTVLSDTQVTAVAPAGSTGPVQVTVVTPGGTSSPVTFTRVPAPGI